MSLLYALALMLLLPRLGAPASGSPFNGFDVFLTPVVVAGGCSVDDVAGFGNRTYRFRGRAYATGTPLTFKSGKAVERNPLGSVEWEPSLADPEVAKVGGKPAVLLVFGADHVGGTGTRTHVLIASCDERRMRILFEASAEGIRDVVVSGDEIRVTRSIWTSTDAHAAPSSQAEVPYRWNRATGRFVAVRPGQK